MTSWLQWLEPHHVDHPEARRPGWSLRAQGAHPGPLCAVHACAWSGPDVCAVPSPRRLGGVFVTPADVVLGLRGWPDAHEWIDAPSGAPVALFDLEKIMRMMLRQDVLALHILGAAGSHHPDSEHSGVAREVVRMCLHKGIARHYIDVARGLRARPFEAWEPGALAPVITGAALVAHGVFALNVRELVALWPHGAVRDSVDDPQDEVAARGALAACQALLEGDHCALPERPTDYDAACALLVEQRLIAMHSSHLWSPPTS